MFPLLEEKLEGQGIDTHVHVSEEDVTFDFQQKISYQTDTRNMWKKSYVIIGKVWSLEHSKSRVIWGFLLKIAK